MTRYDVLTQDTEGGEYYVPCRYEAKSPAEAAAMRVAALDKPLNYTSVAVVEHAYHEARHVYIFDIEPYVPKPAPTYTLVPR